MQFFRKRLNKKGFTLIELIVVIAILGILAMIAIPRLAGFSESARQANDEEIAAIVANAGAMYAASHAEMTEAELEAEIEDQSGLVDEGLIDAVYTDADLESDNYTAIAVDYEQATGTQVTLTGTNGNYVITK